MFCECNNSLKFDFLILFNIKNKYLFQLSPKKTWEGFIGGFFSTVIFGFIVSFTWIFILYFEKW